MSLQRVSLEHELITKRTGGIQSSHMEAFTGIRRQVSINVKAQEHNREENPKPRHLQGSILKSIWHRATVTSVRSRIWGSVCINSNLHR